MIKTIDVDRIEQIQKLLSSFRIDIKNYGTETNDFMIAVSNATISEPKWFTNAQGTGRIVLSDSTKVVINLTIIGNGILKTDFRGQDRRFNGERFPVWIDYKSIKIDGKEILTEPVATWHDKPFKYEMPVNDGQEVVLEIEQQYHEYTEIKLNEILQKLDTDDEYIKGNIEAIITELKKVFPITEKSQREENLFHDRIKVYAPDSFYNFKTYKLSNKLSYEVIRNGVIHAADGWTSFFSKFKDTGFITDENNNWVLSSACYKKSLYSRIPNENNENTVRIVHKKAIFIGAFRQHYGHFLCQGLTRLWFLLEHKYTDYELIYIPQGKMPSFVFKYLKLFGIDEKKLVAITETTMYDEIIVPEISFGLDTFWTEEYKNTINKIKSNIAPVENDKIYLSRMHFTDNCIGEKYIERIFEKNGYKIVYPEELSIEEQISVISGAKNIVGVAGTALHNLIFMQDGATCTILEREIHPNYTQIIINDMRLLRTDYVYANDSFLPCLSGKGPYFLQITKYLCKYFDDKKFDYKEENIANHISLIPTYLLAWYLLYSDDKLYGNLLKSHNVKRKYIEDCMSSLENLYNKREEIVVADKDLSVFETCNISHLKNDKVVIEMNISENQKE